MGVLSAYQPIGCSIFFVRTNVTASCRFCQCSHCLTNVNYRISSGTVIFTVLSLPFRHLISLSGLPPIGGAGLWTLFVLIFEFSGLLSPADGNIQFQDCVEMDKPVYGCSSGHWILEDHLPLGEWQITGNQRTATFIAIGQ